MDIETMKVIELLKEAEEISNIIARIILNAENQE